jgi:hypothetical protein
LESVKSRPLQRLTSKEIVQRVFDLCAVRRPGKAPIFIIDEVGQYVARSGDKLENLRAVVEEFGRAGLERVKKRQIPGPAWVIVTAQEKLQEVYNYIASGRIDLPKLQDRFKYQIDLSPADIREVATKRVLSKKEGKEVILRDLFRKSGPILLQNCKLERTSRRTDFEVDDFVQFYPYLPHFIDLSIDIMTGIRLQPNAPKHLGGSNRTIIKQSYEMLVSDRTNMAQQAVGALVSLDKIYELVEGNIPSEKQKDVLDIRQRFEKDQEHPGLAARVAKAVCLLEFVRDLPRTSRNIASLLLDNVTDPTPVGAVDAVLQKLKEAQFVRETDEGWKLQTAQEKNWEQEKRSYASVKRSERNEILRRLTVEIFAAAKGRQYHYKGLRSFNLGLMLDGQSLPPAGQIPLELLSADQTEDFGKRLDGVASESRQDAKKDHLLWLFHIPAEAEVQIEDLHASQKMIEKYEYARGQQHITELEKDLLVAERASREKLETKLMSTLRKSLESGVGFFRGLKFEAGDLGRDLASMMHGLCDKAVPALYPKVEMGCREMNGDEAEEFLKQANLNNLAPLFHDSGNGLNLVTKEGNRYVPNVKSEIAQEILGFLKREHAYGNKVTGGQVADHFGGIGYGWDRDIVRLVLAVLFRAGAIEVTHQGRRYRNYQDPQARTALVNNTAFKSASFAPRESIDLKTLTLAVRNLEDMLGREVDVEESAIADEFQKMARAERESLLPGLARAEAHRLPLVDRLREWSEALDTVLASQPDDCVRMLAGEGKSLKELRESAQIIRGFLTDKNLEYIEQARKALNNQLPALRSVDLKSEVTSDAEKLSELLGSPELPKRIAQVPVHAQQIDAVFRRQFEERWRRRFEEYNKALNQISESPEFLQAEQTQRDAILSSLRRRAVETFDLTPFGTVETNTGTTLRSVADDLDLLPSLVAGAVGQLRQAVQPSATAEGVEVVRLSDFLSKAQGLEDFTDTEIEQALEKLKEKIFSLRELKRKATWD